MPLRIECGHHQRITASHIVVTAVHAHDHDVHDVGRHSLAGHCIDGLMPVTLLHAKVNAQAHYGHHQQYGHGPPDICITAPSLAPASHFLNLL